jgi:hypothetical protein
MLKKLGLTILGLIAVSGVAVAQYTTQSGGQGAGFPTLNVPADTQCTSYGNPVGGTARCIVYAPAGPTALTGYETFLSDTHAPNGAIPQTMNVPLTAIGGGKLTVIAPLTGDSVALDAQTRQVIVNPAGTIAALTLTMPAASATMVDGSRIGICGTQIVTALTLAAGTGNTFNPAVQTAMLVPVVTGAGSCTEYIYSKTSATAGVWFRTQ